jgi:hypothetical protein
MTDGAISAQITVLKIIGYVLRHDAKTQQTESEIYRNDESLRKGVIF